ncbi:DegQ family serine endoprotease [Marinibactrum halimedae]|uniref:Probable periplasmic serine endoprotease DegP-like n=1 Tax=Marinibactrum halimedae TaxID=1444977 RepID=A0AA37T9S3_9GAMM|nr:serine protease MucD [Marinibactrum halimedae]
MLWRQVPLAFVLMIGAMIVHAQRLPDFSELVEESSPAVVKITTVAKSGRGITLNRPDMEQIPEIFRYFFDPRKIPEREQRSMGSGFILSHDGYVLTNNHVIDGADEITVRLLDRREFEATLVGTDKRSDLALLKIDAERLPHLDFADPEEIQVGEWVLAIGSPFGLDFSASVGIVSAIGRSIPTEENENYVPFIQTDVAINPGNSGGPLFNLKGEVVGINSQIYTRSGGSIGLSFAIPASVAIDVVEQLKSKGVVERGWLGVMIQEVDKDLARSFGLRKPQGALVARVEAGSPADKSGLKVGDIILSFDGKSIKQSGDLPHAVGMVTPGEKAIAEIIREGDRKRVPVMVGALGGGATVAGLSNSSKSVDSLLGVQVESLPDELKREWNLDTGVLVKAIDPNGAAAGAGLRVGDVITQIGFTAIQNVDDFGLVESQLEREALLPIRFIRQGRPVFRTITTPK